MKNLRNRLHITYVFIDCVLLALSFYVPYFLRYNSFLGLLPRNWRSLYLFAFSDYTYVFFFWCTVSLFFLNKYKLFTTNREITIIKEVFLVLKALAFGLIPTAAVIFLLKFKDFSRFVFLVSWIIAFILLSIWRALKRIYIRYRLRKGLGFVRILLAGESPATEAVIKEIKNHPYLGLETAGIITRNTIDKNTSSELKVLGCFDDLEKVIKKYYIDSVFVCINLSPEEIDKFVFTGRKLDCGIKIIPEGFEHIYGEFSTYKLGYIPFFEYGYKRLHGTELFVKRLIDIVGSAFGLFLLSPIIILTAFFIKSEDKGPVFYVSKRVGRKNRIFPFYKFRSMITDAEKMKESLRDKSETTGPIFKIKDDPRITKTGKFIRRFSIDELPQLWNVFKGDMSLVGPRPPTPDEVEKYELWQMRRLEVKPGITCLWQVRGRSNLSFYKWVKWDLWYIDNWSLWLDIKILFWTIPAVLKKDGAY